MTIRCADGMQPPAAFRNAREINYDPDPEFPEEDKVISTWAIELARL
jgi:hypothetical protein